MQVVYSASSDVCLVSYEFQLFLLPNRRESEIRVVSRYTGSNNMVRAFIRFLSTILEEYTRASVDGLIYVTNYRFSQGAPQPAPDADL